MHEVSDSVAYLSFDLLFTSIFEPDLDHLFFFDASCEQGGTDYVRVVLTKVLAS